MVLAVYVAAAALMPLSHHDLACHFKSTTHCTTCNLGASGEPASDLGGLARAGLADAGHPGLAPTAIVDSVAHGATAGRSPPAQG